MPLFAVVVRNGRRFVVGAIAQTGSGFRFLPYTQHSPSRRDWPSAAECLPRWARFATIVDAASASDAMREREAAEAAVRG